MTLQKATPRTSVMRLTISSASRLRGTPCARAPLPTPRLTRRAAGGDGTWSLHVTGKLVDDAPGGAKEGEVSSSRLSPAAKDAGKRKSFTSYFKKVISPSPPRTRVEGPGPWGGGCGGGVFLGHVCAFKSHGTA